MAEGIIIHIAVGKESRTEYFGEETIRLGSDESCDLQIHSKRVKEEGVWLEIELDNGTWRVVGLNEDLGLEFNGEPLPGDTIIRDGDSIKIDSADISFSFFSLESESSLITTNRDPHLARFIEEAAIGSSVSEKRDDAKAFLREFSRELISEVSLTTKLITLVLVVSVLSAGFYLAYGFYKETQLNRQQAEERNRVIKDLKDKVAKTSDEIVQLDKSNKDIIKNISLAPNLRVDYGNGVCLVVGMYDLVSRANGKVLRYPDPDSFKRDDADSRRGENGVFEVPATRGITTEGKGTPVEYDFIGTGFHVGDGYVLTNRHVLQPWTEDDLVKDMMREARGRARVRKLVVYFPGSSNPYRLRIRKVSYRQDLAVGWIDYDPEVLKIPVLPLDTESVSVAIGKTVVTMGYPNGPNRLLAMVDDVEAKSINRRYGNSRQALINYLARSGKIVPLTTQGAITDLDSKRIVHDARTAEGGSGAPLFGQSGKVIGVNFGIFTENDASNLAIPVRFARKLLEEAGWKTNEALTQSQISASSNSEKADSPTE